MRTIFWSIVVLLILLLPARAEINQQIQEAITAQNANWIPGTYQKRSLGFLPDFERASHAYPTADVPQKFSLQSFAPMVKDQAKCGACVAFATVGMFETQFNIWTGLPIYNLDMSEQYLFNCGGGKCDSGWTFKPAVKFLKSTGIPDELCLPYTAKDVKCSAACADADKRLIKIKSWSSVDYKDIPAAIASSKVVLTGMAVYDDFFAYKSGIYEHVTGDLAGYHAVLVVGYDLDEKYFLIRNSWGADWGEAGYFRIKITDESMSFDGYVIDIK